MLRARIEAHFNRIWYQGRPPPLAYRWLAGAYGALVRRRSQRPSLVPKVPVIVVGNLTVGGGGKTPLVIALAQYLRSSGRQVAVVSRGYGGRRVDLPQRVDEAADPYHYGDEPVLIAEQAGVPVWVCRHRARALQAAVDDGAEVVLSDDGLQHMALARSFEICLIDGSRGLGNGRLLPAGPLRQPVERLKAVDLLLVKGAGQMPAGSVRVDLQARQLRPMQGGPALTPAAWHGKTVTALCGIANPQGFFDLLEALGMVVQPRIFPDHHRFRGADLDGLQGPVVVTAKDAVKLRRLSLDMDIRVLVVGLELPEAVTAAIEQHLEQWSEKHA